jgi:hypothetical protein
MFDNLQSVHARVDLRTSQRSTRLHCAFSAQIELKLLLSRGFSILPGLDD